MRKIILILGLIFLGYANECDDLIKKYHAPNPKIKTMNQLKRWVRRKLKNIDQAEKKKVLKCLISRAADNPNAATVSGE